jgi:hypothetical protein
MFFFVIFINLLLKCFNDQVVKPALIGFRTAPCGLTKCNLEGGAVSPSKLFFQL